MTSVERAANVIAKELADNERDERARMTSVECAAKVVERDRKCAEKEAEEEAQRVAKAARDCKRAEKEAEKAQRVAKAAERDAKWTADVDAMIERMIDGGYSYDKIASKLGNDLTKMDIYHRWTGYLKELSGIIKPAVQVGRKSCITWTAEDDATIVSMREVGSSFAKIASKLGKGLNDIQNRWNRHLKDFA
jgi:hypothetical protein